MLNRIAAATLACACVFAPSIALATTKTHPVAHRAVVPNPQERRSITHHRISLGGREIAYTATAGTLILKNDKEKPEASVFYVAYTEDGSDHNRRPVTFLYNGGPGAASVFLHMGALGPRRISFPNAQNIGGPPYRLVDNQYSLLDTSDLIFIDAPGTGYSRLMPGIDPKTIYGIDQDAAAFGQFIERYVTLNDRWNSPKFLLGESYGTPRSATLVDYLQNRNMSFNGVVLLSSVLDFSTIAPGPGNDLAYVTYLPTEAAVRWYHDSSPAKGSLESAVDQARTFANGPFASALIEGSRLPHDRQLQIAASMSKLIGLNARYIDESNLRVAPGRFEKELMREEGKTTGRLDARYTGYDLDRIADSAEYDPSDTASSGAFQSMFLAYVRNELNWKSDETYKQINGDANQTWDFTRKSVFYWLAPTTSPDLQEAMTSNPRLRVFVGAGYFDMATPFGAAEWTFSHLGLPAELRSNVTFGYYESGHMVYMHQPSLVKFKSDLARFYQQSTQTVPQQ
ncbi:MAG: peptidase S10 [Candidatus Eremiobacteraeota bacterium]|nr:peptidase S10 [Candidatus Eremiobacteraeota bacterium]